MAVGWLGHPAISKTSCLPDSPGYPLDSTCCCYLLLKQVTDSHQFKPTDLFTGNHYIQYKCYKKYRVDLIIGDLNYSTMDNGNCKQINML